MLLKHLNPHTSKPFKNLMEFFKNVRPNLNVFKNNILFIFLVQMSEILTLFDLFACNCQDHGPVLWVVFLSNFLWT
jgi:hypothetical protein